MKKVFLSVLLISFVSLFFYSCIGSRNLELPPTLRSALHNYKGSKISVQYKRQVEPNAVVYLKYNGDFSEKIEFLHYLYVSIDEKSLKDKNSFNFEEFSINLNYKTEDFSLVYIGERNKNEEKTIEIIARKKGDFTNMQLFEGKASLVLYDEYFSEEEIAEIKNEYGGLGFNIYVK